MHNQLNHPELLIGDREDNRLSCVGCDKKFWTAPDLGIHILGLHKVKYYRISIYLAVASLCRKIASYFALPHLIRRYFFKWILMCSMEPAAISVPPNSGTHTCFGCT